MRHMINKESFDDTHDFKESILKEENTWSFGQVAPVLLLLTPILLLCEGFSGRLNIKYFDPSVRILTFVYRNGSKEPYSASKGVF